MSGLELGIAAGVMAAGALVQGSAGFGMNLVAVPILLILDPALVPGPTLVAALVITSLVAVRERRSLDVRGLIWAYAGRVPGAIAGALVVALLPRRHLSITLACAVLVAVALSAAGWHVEPTGRNLLGAGALSGLMATVVSIGGPPMALVVQRSPGKEVRAMLAGFFVFGAILSLALLALVGRFGVPEAQASLVLMPGLVAGFVVSRWTAPVLDRGHTRTAVLVLSGASGVAALLRYTL